MTRMVARMKVSRNAIVPMCISFEWRFWLSRLLVEGGRNFCPGIGEHRGSEQGWEGGFSEV